MNYSCFIGIDLSKKTFDVTVLSPERHEQGHSRFENTTGGMDQFLTWLQAEGVDTGSALFCAENMGSCATELCLFAVRHSLSLTLACPLDIKRSVGLQRGKNDRVDARRIANHAVTRVNELKLYSLPDPVITRLKACLLIRENLVKTKRSREAIKDTVAGMEKLADVREQEEFLDQSIEECKVRIKKIEEDIKRIIKEDEGIEVNIKLLKSITGIGTVNAVMMVCLTGNFQRFADHRKFACYCGLAPFEYSSGTSIRGRTRISAMANRGMKVLLTSAALAAIGHDPWMRAYYKRKVEEGKYKATVINAVRAKLAARCFAVVRRQVPFIKMM